MEPRDESAACAGVIFGRTDFASIFRCITVITPPLARVGAEGAKEAKAKGTTVVRVLASRDDPGPGQRRAGQSYDAYR